MSPARYTGREGPCPPASGFIAGVIRAGVNFANRFTLVATEQRPAVAVDASRQANRISQSPAFDLDALGATGTSTASVTSAVDLDASLRSFDGTTVKAGVTAVPSLQSVDPAAFRVNAGLDTDPLVSGTGALPASNPAMALSPRISEHHKDANPAVDIVQVTYNLNRRVGANANSNGGGTAWTSPANAEGLNNGVNATSVGGALAVTQTIELDYANSVGKADLAITEVRLFVYLDITDATNVCTRTISYNIGGGLVTLETGTGTVDYLPTPKEFVLPITTWAQFDALKTRVVTAYAAVSSLSNAALDAIEVRVLANRTDNP